MDIGTFIPLRERKVFNIPELNEDENSDNNEQNIYMRIEKFITELIKLTKHIIINHSQKINDKTFDNYSKEAIKYTQNRSNIQLIKILRLFIDNEKVHYYNNDLDRNPQYSDFQFINTKLLFTEGEWHNEFEFLNGAVNVFLFNNYGLNTELILSRIFGLITYYFAFGLYEFKLDGKTLVTIENVEESVIKELILGISQNTNEYFSMSLTVLTSAEFKEKQLEKYIPKSIKDDTEFMHSYFTGQPDNQPDNQPVNETETQPVTEPETEEGTITNQDEINPDETNQDDTLPENNNQTNDQFNNNNQEYIPKLREINQNEFNKMKANSPLLQRMINEVRKNAQCKFVKDNVEYNDEIEDDEDDIEQGNSFSLILFSNDYSSNIGEAIENGNEVTVTVSRGNLSSATPKEKITKSPIVLNDQTVDTDQIDFKFTTKVITTMSKLLININFNDPNNANLAERHQQSENEIDQRTNDFVTRTNDSISEALEQDGLLNPNIGDNLINEGMGIVRDTQREISRTRAEEYGQQTDLMNLAEKVLSTDMMLQELNENIRIDDKKLKDRTQDAIDNLSSECPRLSASFLSSKLFSRDMINEGQLKELIKKMAKGDENQLLIEELSTQSYEYMKQMFYENTISNGVMFNETDKIELDKELKRYSERMTLLTFISCYEDYANEDNTQMFNLLIKQLSNDDIKITHGILRNAKSKKRSFEQDTTVPRQRTIKTSKNIKNNNNNNNNMQTEETNNHNQQNMQPDSNINSQQPMDDFDDFDDFGDFNQNNIQQDNGQPQIDTQDNRKPKIIPSINGPNTDVTKRRRDARENTILQNRMIDMNTESEQQQPVVGSQPVDDQALPSIKLPVTLPTNATTTQTDDETSVVPSTGQDDSGTNTVQGNDDGDGTSSTANAVTDDNTSGITDDNANNNNVDASNVQATNTLDVQSAFNFLNQAQDKDEMLKAHETKIIEAILNDLKQTLDQLLSESGDMRQKITNEANWLNDLRKEVQEVSKEFNEKSIEYETQNMIIQKLIMETSDFDNNETALSLQNQALDRLRDEKLRLEGKRNQTIRRMEMKEKTFDEIVKDANKLEGKLKNAIEEYQSSLEENEKLTLEIANRNFDLHKFLKTTINRIELINLEKKNALVRSLKDIEENSKRRLEDTDAEINKAGNKNKGKKKAKQTELETVTDTNTEISPVTSSKPLSDPRKKKPNNDPRSRKLPNDPRRNRDEGIPIVNTSDGPTNLLATVRDDTLTYDDATLPKPKAKNGGTSTREAYITDSNVLSRSMNELIKKFSEYTKASKERDSHIMKLGKKIDENSDSIAKVFQEMLKELTERKTPEEPEVPMEVDMERTSNNKVAQVQIPLYDDFGHYYGNLPVKQNEMRMDYNDPYYRYGRYRNPFQRETEENTKEKHVFYKSPSLDEQTRNFLRILTWCDDWTKDRTARKEKYKYKNNRLVKEPFDQIVENEISKSFKAPQPKFNG